MTDQTCAVQGFPTFMPVVSSGMPYVPPAPVMMLPPAPPMTPIIICTAADSSKQHQKDSSSNLRQIIATITTIALGVFITIYGGLMHSVPLVAVGAGILGIGSILLAPRIGFEGFNLAKKIRNFFSGKKQEPCPPPPVEMVPIYPHTDSAEEIPLYSL